MTTQDGAIQPCSSSDRPRILEIINEAAQRYRGAIPDDCFHEPYMSMEEFEAELKAGVEFWGVGNGGSLVGVMGIQPVQDVILIRHAYVAREAQGRGIGSRLLLHLLERADRPVLIGTWAAAAWAISFYRKHGFELVSPDETRHLLRTYWTVPPRQAEVSVVLRRRDPQSLDE